MANTTFNGTVRSESGLKVVSKNSTTGAYTDKMTFDSSGRLITTTGSHLKYTAVTGYGPADLIVGKGGSSAATADPFSESSTALFPLGTKLVYNDRTFVYGGVGGTAITAGKLVQHVTEVAHHTNMTATAAVDAGETAISVETNGTDLTANQYAEGYLFVNDANGEGQCLRVKSHPAHDHSSDPSVVITCYDDLATALTTSSELTLMPNAYDNLVVAPTTHTGACVGATTIDMTADYYGWFQTKGPAALLTDGTLVLTAPAVRSDGTAGAVEVLDSDADAESQVIGQVMCVSADTEYSLIWMNI
tara:strand:+ start:173 stop:1084 length:912 start_codon:yes stop_codon:yes gene_type:complete